MSRLFGKNKSKVEVPGYIKDASKHNIAYAQDAARLGYVPYYGLDVAAFGPAANAATSAMGIGPTDLNFATPMQGPGGTSGFASYPMFAAQQDMWNANAPGQAAAYRAMFMDPMTADMAVRDAGGMQAVQPMAPSLAGTPGYSDYNSTDRDRTVSAPTGGNLGFGGYTGLGDMIDGGGPGTSGTTFQGPVSGLSNAVANPRDPDRERGGLFGGFGGLFGS